MPRPEGRLLDTFSHFIRRISHHDLHLQRREGVAKGRLQDTAGRGIVVQRLRWSRLGQERVDSDRSKPTRPSRLGQERAIAVQRLRWTACVGPLCHGDEYPSRTLQNKGAQLEARPRRQSAEFARRNPARVRDSSPEALPGRRPRSPSPGVEQRDSDRELIDQLEEMDIRLTARLATASQLVTVPSVLGAADRRTSAPRPPPASHPEAKPSVH